MNDTEIEIQNLLEARKKIDERIKLLRNNVVHIETVKLSKGEGGRNPYWKSVYRCKIKKISDAVESENGRYVTIAEDPDLDHVYEHIWNVRKDLSELLVRLDQAKEEKGEKNEDIKQ